MKIETVDKSPLEKSWGNYIDVHEPGIRHSLLKAIASAFETNTGFIVVKKDRSGGYRIEHKQWPEVIEALKDLGAIGGYNERRQRRRDDNG